MTDSNFLNPTDPNMDATFNHFNDKMLPDEMVVNAVHRACDFFGIPEVPVINAHGACVWPNDTSTYDDDVFGFNREQLMSLGISGEDSLTLIYTHECAHRTLQGSYNDAWEEELACDFFAGIHAGMKGMNVDNFEASLGSTEGGSTHPNGALRANFIEYGKQVAQDLKARHIDITYGNCLERLNEHLEAKRGLIAEYRQHFNYNALANLNVKNATMADVEWYEHQARISSGSEQDHWIKEAKWARDHLNG